MTSVGYYIYNIHVFRYTATMYIFYILFVSDVLKAIYSKDDLDHYCVLEATLYCRLLFVT